MDDLPEERLSAALRLELRSLRRKALAGKLALAEFQAFRAKLRGNPSPLRSLLSALKTAKRRAAASGVPSDVRAEIDRLVERVQGLLQVSKRVVSLAGFRGKRAVSGL